jgi:RNA polymerase sigma-70 factor (ECF subfamily)
MSQTPVTPDLRLAQAGDDDALTRLLESFRTYLQLMAAGELDLELRAKMGASDLVQDTMIEARRDFNQFAGNTTEEFTAWLRQILRNNLANVRRRYLHTLQRRVSREVSFGGNDSRARICSLSDPSATPQAKAIAREEDELIDATLARLPPDYREVVLLHHAKGLSFVEIGQRIGRTAEAVRKLWSRAIDRMQEKLAEDVE